MITSHRKPLTSALRSIFMRLNEMDWGTEYNSMTDSEYDRFGELKVVKQAIPLTDRSK